MPLTRRSFLAATTSLAFAPFALAADAPRDIKVTRVTAFDLITRRKKFIGKNARLDDHGDSSRDRLVILQASDGSQGFGCCRADAKTLAALLGQAPATEGLGVHTMPAWDLLGKILKKPVYRLLN